MWLPSKRIEHLSNKLKRIVPVQSSLIRNKNGWSATKSSRGRGGPKDSQKALCGMDWVKINNGSQEEEVFVQSKHYRAKLERRGRRWDKGPWVREWVEMMDRFGAEEVKNLLLSGTLRAGSDYDAENNLNRECWKHNVGYFEWNVG